SARGTPMHGAMRFKYLFGTIVAFALGVALPVALFVFFYMAHGAVRELLNGLFVAPMQRLTFTVHAPGGPYESWPTLVLLGVVLLAVYFRATIWIALAFLTTVVY